MEQQNLKRYLLSNGVTLITIPNETADVIAGRIFVKKAGSRFVSLDKAGLSHLLAAVMTKGTQTMSALEIAEAVESVGASLGADSTADYFVLSLKTVSRDFAEMFKLAGEILRSPTIPPAEFELEQKLTIQNIRSQQEQPFNLAFAKLRQAMYQNHPYSLSVLGTEETVANLVPADLVAHHQTYFRPDNLVVTIAGRISAKEAINLVETVLGDWQNPLAALPEVTLPVLSPQPSQSLTPQATQQSIIMLGYLTPAVFSEDYAALKLISTYLGNGLSSRLFVELREKRGLAYDVSAFYPTRLDYAQFVTYMGTSPANTKIAIESLKSEVERLINKKLSNEEIERAKTKLLGQYALGKQTNSELAQIYGWYETLGLGVDFDSKFQTDINQVTTTEVQQVANRYLTQPYVSLVGPTEAIEYV